MIGVNDVPLAGTCPGACGTQTPSGQGVAARCQCVWFILWRLSNDLHVHLGAGYNDASTWDEAARAQGFHVDGSAAIHSVLQLNAGEQGAGAGGHVGLVLEVGPSAHAPAGHVWVENYNASGRCTYSHDSFATSPGRFIHFADAPAPPSSGVHLVNFSVIAYPGGGQTLHVRTGPGTQYPIIGGEPQHAALNCDAWAYGEEILDPYNRVKDRRWYRIRGSGWVASALVGGDAPGSKPQP